MEQSDFDHMVSSCPLLESLTMADFDGINILNINAPNLQFFDVQGSFQDLNFYGTDHLAFVKMVLCDGDCGIEGSPSSGGNENLVKFFSCLPHIQDLMVDCVFLERLAAGNIPEKLPAPCVHLDYLSIHFSLSEIREFRAAFCILRSSPNLRELEILIGDDETSSAVPNPHGVLETTSFQFNQLRLIEMVGVSGLAHQLMFMRFMLANSPALEKMNVYPTCKEVECALMKELLRFRRASARAEIIVVDP